MALTPMNDGREVVEEYRSVGLSLKQHPVRFLREALRARRMLACSDLQQVRDGRRVVVAASCWCGRSRARPRA